MEGRPNIQARRILRSPSLKRKSRIVPVSEKVLLDRVLGLTVTNGAALDTDPTTGTIAYPAGCVIVMYNSRKNKQSHICNQCKKTITCLAFSMDGKFLVTGESGHMPAVRVWDLEDNNPIAQFSGHQFGINCVAFSPNLKYIVSVGTQHDMMVNVWNWKTNAKVASNKIASNVVSIAFTEDSSSFVTVGNRHVKFWYLDASKSRVKETVPLLGRSGILGERKNNFFNGVCCGRGAMVGNTYCITHSGLLCEFNEKRLLSKWVELRTPCAYCLTVGEEYLYVGCADGIVRIFNSRTLNYLSTLPRPHQLGVDIATAVDSSQLLATQDSTASFPDTIAVSLDEDSNKLTCVYNDHSLYIWDVHDIHKIGKTHSFLYHSACIWSAEMYPDVDENPALPPGSFITCSSDDTMRIWNMDAHATTSNTAFRRNIYSNELLKVIYTDPELNNIKDVKFNPAGKTDRTDTGFLEKNGVRAVRVCPRGQHMASGDRVGNIRIHDLHTMEQCHILEAHDSEVLCLEFTNPSTTGVHFLSSASRDRLIHVFDVGQQYGLVQTLDDHSSAITSVKFAEDGDTLHMITCGADKSLLFRTAQMTPHFQFVLNRHLVGKTTLYDMDVDATKKFVVTACQDRNVRIYNIKNGKKKKCYSGSVGSEGTLIRVELDQSGAYLATTCSNKNICLYDFFSGELIASMYGHSEVVTGVKFMNDLKHLISVSGDGCIFVWRLPPEVTEHMHSRLVELGKKVTLDTPRQEDFDRSVLASDKVTDQKDGFSDVIGLLENNFPGDQTDNFPDDRTHTVPEHDSKTNYRFSVGQLPSWAKKQVLQGSGGRQQMEEVDVKSAAPRGRWAENPGIVMKSVLDESSPMKLPLSDIFNCHRFPPGLELASDKLHTVPVVDDDEYNQDDSDDDEFKVLGLGNTDTQSDDRISFLRNCEFGCGDSTEGDDGDETVDREVIYYPANRDDSVSTPSSTFPVFEDRKLKARDDAGLEDMSEDDTDTPQTSSPSTPATEHMKTFPSDDNNMKFIQNNYESLTETEKFDTNLDEVMENCNMTMFPTARLSFSRKFLSNAPSRYPLRNNHAHQSSRHAKTAPPATQPTVSGVGSSDNSSHTEDKMIARSAVRQTDTQQKTAHTQQQTTKWLPPEENKLSTSSRQWKSMLDVAGNGSSKQERAPRSRTPNPLHPVLAARRSFSPSTGLIGGSSELKLPPRRRSMKDDKTLAAPERLSSTRTTGEKATKALGMRLHSYSKATESSNAKKMPRASSNNQMDKLEEAGASRCTGGVISNSKEPRLSQKLRPSRKGNLNAAQKAKFKSTPNLMELNENETDITPMMSASKTMEDLETVDPMRSPPTLPSSRSELRAYKDRSRRSMPVTRDTKGLFTAVESPSGVYSVDLPLNTTFSILSPEHRVLSTESASRTVRQPNNSGPGNEDEDRIAMPPPASHVTIPPPASHVTMPSIAREDKDNSTNKKPEMSLNQAKDILLGRHHAPIAGADKSGSSTIPLQNSKNTKGSTRVMSNTGSVEVERDSRLEPSPLELPVKDSSASEGQQDSMPRVSTEPVLGASRARSMWHSRDQCASPIRTESRPRHRAGAHRRSYSPSPITLARTLSPMTVVNINSEPCARTPMSQPVSTTDIDLSQPAQTDVPVVEGANNGSEPAVNQTEVITSELDTSTMQPADGSNQQQMQLNEFFMSLLSRNSSTASDLEQQMTSSPSDDRPKPGHTAAARSMWENAIQQRDSAQSRRPGVRSKCVRVDSNANCLQGEGDAVSEVTQSEKDRLEHAKTYRSPHSPIVSPVLSSAHEVESAAEPEEILSPTATPGIGGIAISRTEISPVKSNSPPTANLPVPVKSSSPPSVDLPVPVKSSSPPTANLPVHCKSSLPPTTHMPVPAKSSSPPTADLPVPVKSSSPATADLPVPAKSSLPTTADLPVPVKSSSPPTAELPVPAKSSSPPTADLPVAAKSSLPTTADLPVPAKSSLPTTVPVKSCSPPTADLPVPAKSSSPPTADLPVPVNSSSPPTADLPVPAKSSSPPTADLPVPAKSRLPPTVNKGSCTQPSTGPICVSETCKDKQEVSVLTQPAIVNVRANRSRLNLPLEGVTAVVTPKDAEQTCCQLHTTLQETLTMYSQVCSQEDTDEKKELLRRTLVETRQWIDNTLGDRPPPVTAFLDTVSTTGVVDTSVAMLEHYSLQLADRVCALVHDRLLPPGDTTHDTKL